MMPINVKVMNPRGKVTRKSLSTFSFINWWNHTMLEEIHPLRPYERYVEHQIARDKAIMSRTTFYKLTDIALRYCHAMHEKTVEELEDYV